MPTEQPDSKNGQRLSILNEHRRVVPGPRLLHELVPATAIGAAEKIAIDYLSADQTRQSITYAQLQRGARHVAARIQDVVAHPRKQGIIPVLLPQCPLLYVAYLAILQVGAAFCPVAIDTPSERLKFIVADTDAAVVITLPEHQQMVDELLPDLTCVVVTAADLHVQQNDVLYSTCGSSNPPAISPQDIAYIMYTSGSTGVPKAVSISHQSVTQSLLAHDEHIPTFARFLQFASPVFDVSIFEIFFPLFRNATLVCRDREQMLGDLPGTLTQLEVDAVELTPTVAGTLLRRRDAAPSLRILLTIGEMLTRHVVDEFGGTESQRSMLYAMYGPTEASIHCTLAVELSVASSVKNIGVPLSTVTAYVISERSQESNYRVLPIGEVGELAIAGQLANGYLNRPDQTSAAFIDLKPHGNVYRTGDRARITESGELHILGRIAAGQVKLRGQRVELGEIEETAYKSSGVEMAIASVFDEQLILFCTGSPSLSTQEISRVCKLWLPRFMRPNKVVLLPSLPRLPSGKVDRLALETDYKASVLDMPSDDAHFESTLSHQLALDVSDELGVKLAARTPLTSYGIDSLRAITIVSALRPKYPLLTVLMLLESETVEDLASHLDGANQVNGSHDAPQLYETTEHWALMKAGVMKGLSNERGGTPAVNVLPCSSMQIAMLMETAANEKMNFNTIELHIASHIILDDFKGALRQVAMANGILRSGFQETNSSRMPFVQIIWQSLSFDKQLSLLHPIIVRSTSDHRRVLVQLHHALYDGWSWDLIISDINSILTQRPLELRPQFQHLCNYQELVRESSGASDKVYWSDYLEGLNRTSFPSLCSVRARATSYQTCMRTFKIGKTALSRYASDLRVSRQTVLQAALSLLLSAYCDSSDVLYGVVSSGREKPVDGVDQIIGPCLSTYPMRVKLAAVRTCRDLMLYINRMWTAILKHGSLDLTKIKESANLSPADSLFDILCVWQEGLDIITTSDVVRTVDAYDMLNYTMVLEAEPGRNSLDVKLTFDDSKIPTGHAELVLAQLDHITLAMMSDQHSSLKDIWSSLDPSSLSVCNENYRTFNNDFSLTTTIEALSARDPDRHAVDFVINIDKNAGFQQVDHLTYRELYHRSAHIAKVLIGVYNVQPNDQLCVLLDKSLHLYEVILAIILSGAGYMCIDIRTPRSRVAQILSEAKCKVIITDDLTSLRTCREDASAIAVLYYDLHNMAAPETLLPKNVLGQNLAYTVFTSGTTGTPKGMQVTRHNLLSNIDELSKLYPCQRENGKLLQACSPAFDVSVFEIFWTWHMGMTICSAKNEILFFDIERLINTMSITHLSMTPSVAALIDPMKAPGIEMLVTAGEPMRLKVFQSWSGRGLYQGYGPSETTNICNVRCSVHPDDQINNVGPPLANTSIFICRKGKSHVDEPLDAADFSILPKGAIGEVWIGGEQVCRGYIDQHQTKRSFFNHPKYGRLYRSGDIGKLLADGSLTILGRKDSQVKLRGQRIELGDISSTLIKHNLVKDTVTLLTSEASGGKLLSFYVLRNPRGELLPEDRNKKIFEWLQDQLPSYMIPDAAIPVKEIHLTRQGKIDHRLLTDIYARLDGHDKELYSRGHRDADSNSLLSATEQQIAGVLSTVTDTPVPTITRNASFFSLGIDSISSIRFAQALRNLGFDNVDVSLILRFPSIAQLTRQLENGPSDSHTVPRGIGMRDLFNAEWQDGIRAKYNQHGYKVHDILPCTPLQEVMMLLGSHGERTAYNNTLTFMVSVEPAVLREAWNQMMYRHELLRTAFVETTNPDRPFAQVILSSFKLPWFEQADSNASLPQNQGIDMPPYHFNVKHDARGIGCTLQFTIHHCLYDAEAMSTLLQEVQRVIRGEALDPPVSFTRYLEYMIDLTTAKANSFWKKQLDKFEPLRLQSIVPSCSPKQVELSVVSHVIRRDLDKLEKRNRGNGITLLVSAQVALTRLLSVYMKRSQVCFGNVFSGRNLDIQGVEQIVGPCFNTLPISVNLSKRLTVRDLSILMQQKSTAILDYQPSSLRHIQKQHSPDGRALFDVLLLLQQEQQSMDDSIWTLERETGDMIFPFIFEIIPSKERNELQLNLHCQNCDSGLATRILANFDRLLEHTILYPEALASDLTAVHEETILKLDQHDVVLNKRQSGAPSTQNYERVWSKTEVRVRKTLLQLARSTTESISLSTTIFHLGLDSIHAVQVAARLRKLGFKINTNDVLEASSIEEIAKICDDCPKDEATTVIEYDFAGFEREHRSMIIAQTMLNTDSIESVLPCTPLQCGILSQFVASHGTLYYNRTRLLLEGAVDLDKLKLAWTSIVHRHEILRTGFVQLDDLKNPYAMIVFRTDASFLPWNTEPMNQSNGPSARGIQVLTNLHQSPWQIDVHCEDGACYTDVWMLHALYDAHSLQTIFREVSIVYNAGKLPPKISPLQAIAEILQRSKQSEDTRKFWMEARNQMHATQSPDLRVYQGAQEETFTTSYQLDVTEKQVRGQCSKLNVNLQSVCQLVWAKLLAAYTGLSTVTFGVVLAGRDFTDDNVNRVVFPCINTIPFTIDVVNNQLSLLEEVSKRNSKIMKYQFTPLAAIKKWNAISENGFDTLLVLQNPDDQPDVSIPWTVVAEEASAEYNVSLEVISKPGNNNLGLRMTGNLNTIPPGQAQLMLQQFEAIFIEQLQISDESIVRGNSNLFSVLPPKSDPIVSDASFLHELVEQTANSKPHSAALEFAFSIDSEGIRKQVWTYTELNDIGTQFANLLIAEHAQVGDLIAVCFDKCPEASFSILGILKAGCAYVAIDPGAPQARKDFILQDARCKILLTTSDKKSDFDQKAVKVIPVNESGSLRNIGSGTPKLNGVLTDDSTCYCLYTSGTTGTPKGCLISHKSAVQAMMSFQRIFRGRWDENSRWLQFAAFHFDVSVLEQYWSWSVGICMTSAPRDLLFEDLPGTINKLGITHLDLTPSLAKLLTPEDVPSLCSGVFIVGGEQVGQEILDIWGDVGCLYNFYGPSEVTIGCTVHPQVPKNAKPTNIGQQWDNVGSFVLEPHSEKPVLRGTVGELCLSGSLVGKGYLNRPDLTGEKFVTLKDYNIRVYRTGDLVRLLHDDSFEFLGRIDDQVKLRGQRLEIGEINHVISGAHGDIRDVSTLVLKHPRQEKEQLVAFISTARSRKADKDDIKRSISKDAGALTAQVRLRCSERLPPYMVPTSFICIEFMPLNANNKTDNKALKAWFESSAIQSLEENDTSKSNMLDAPDSLEHVRKTLAKYLKMKQTEIKPTSRLFELGLDSISAISLARILKREGFKNSDVQKIMTSSTVFNLARNLQLSTTQQTKADVEAAKTCIGSFAADVTDTVVHTLGVSSYMIEHICPCTPLQEGMISKASSQLTTDMSYFTLFIFKLDTDINVQRLQEVWVNLASHLAILRTKFILTESGYAQVVLKEVEAKAIQTLEVESPEHIIQAFSDWKMIANKFDKTLPWQTCFHEAAEGERYMSLFMFHGLYDGISMDLLLHLVKTHYQRDGHLTVSTPQFYEALPYGPLCLRKDAKDYWQQNVHQVNTIGFRDDGRSSILEPLVSRVTLSLPYALSICNQLDVTLPAVFHAAWLYVLQKHYSINPTIGIVVSGRSIDYDNADTVIGPLFNTIPCSIMLKSPKANLHDLMLACHKFNVQSLPFQHTPLRDIRKWLGMEPKKPLFDSLFVFQKSRKGVNDDCATLWSEIELTSSPDYPLNLEIDDQGGGQHFGLTIVMKRSAEMNEDVADVLLVSLTQVLQNLERGTDIVLDDTFTNVDKTRSRNPWNTASSENQSYTVDIDSWTDTQVKIRAELASLLYTDHEVIGLQRPTIFELGLDSIDALKLAARLKKVGLLVPVSKIMSLPTVGGIAAYLEGERSSTTKPTVQKNTILDRQSDYRQILVAQGSDVGDIEVVFPVTSMQEGLLLDPKTYYNVLSYQVCAGVDVERLSTSVQRVVGHLPVMRSWFVALENVHRPENFLQVVGQVARVVVERIRMGSWQHIEQLVTEMKEVITDLTDLRQQRSRFNIATVPDGRAVLLIGMPHSMYDAWSLQLLHKYIQNDYAGVECPEQNISTLIAFVDETNDERRQEQSRSCWAKLLTGCTPTLPKLTRQVQIQSPAILLQKVSNVALEDALGICKNLGITLQSLGVACWISVLASITGCLDILHGLVLSGRTTDGAEDLIFPTFNTVCFRTQLQPHLSRREWLKQVHNTAIDVMNHQHFPLKEALKLAGKPQSELFNTLFTFQKVPGNHEEILPLYEEMKVDVASVNPPYAINVEMSDADGHIQWTVAVQANIADHERVAQMVEQLDIVLENLISAPEMAVLDNTTTGLTICGLDTLHLSNNSSHETQQSSKDNVPSSSHSEDPWTDVELTIRNVIAQVANVEIDEIKKDTGVFYLGLDSVSAIKITSLLRKQNIKLSVSQLIRAGSVGAMAKTATQDSQLGSIATKPFTVNDERILVQHFLKQHDLPRDLVEDVIPASAGQIYMLETWKASQGNLFHADFWLVASRISQNDLQTAIRTLTRNVPVLRTTFINVKGKLVAIVLKTDLVEQYLGLLPWSLESFSRGEDLLIHLKIHHALYDAVSLQFMVEALASICSHGGHPMLYTDMKSFVNLTQSSEASAVAKRRTFWTSYLNNDSEGASSDHCLKGSFTSSRKEYYEPELLSLQQLRVYSRKYGVSMQALFFAAYARVHVRLRATSKDKTQSEATPSYVTFGIYVSNRSLDLPNLPQLMAPTLNIIPLKIDVHSSTSIVSAASKIQEDLQEITQAHNCGVTLSEIYQWTGIHLDAYMNFIRLPDQGDEKQDPSTTKDEARTVSITHAEGETLEHAKEILRSEHDVTAAASPFLLDNLDQKSSEANTTDLDTNWCIPAINIEAKITPDGYLAVGIFAPGDMIGDEVQVLDDIKTTLQSALDDDP